MNAARLYSVDVVHALDYRIPLDNCLTVVTTIHDVLRLADPEHCYDDDSFARRFGIESLKELTLATGRTAQHHFPAWVTPMR